MNSAGIGSQLDLPREDRTHADVCAVIVTYNPDSSLERNVQALLPQVGKLIIADNQSSSAAHSLIARIGSDSGVEIIWNDRNLGIAAGLNAGVERALSCGQYSWIALFDQDSLASPDYVSAIIKAYLACSFRDRVAMIGANYKIAMRESTSEPTSGWSGSIVREVKTLMTSGSLVKSSVFNQCGRFDQSLFMDYVDHEYCLRLRQNGFKILQASRAVLDHRLGSPTSHRFLWKRFTTANYGPARRYSNTRNRLVVYRRYLASDPLWILLDIWKWIPEIAKMALVERNRKEKIVSLARGCRDGIRENLGVP